MAVSPSLPGIKIEVIPVSAAEAPFAVADGAIDIAISARQLTPRNCRSV